MKPQPNQSSTKKYFLTDDEKNNLDSRHQMIKQWQYIIHAINAEIQGYLNFVVLKRLGLEGKNFVLSQDNTFITLPGTETGGEHEPDTSQGK